MLIRQLLPPSSPADVEEQHEDVSIAFPCYWGYAGSDRKHTVDRSDSK